MGNWWPIAAYGICAALLIALMAVGAGDGAVRAAILGPAASAVRTATSVGTTTACSSDNVSISFANRSAFTKSGRLASNTLRRRSKSSQHFTRAVTSTAPDKSENSVTGRRCRSTYGRSRVPSISIDRRDVFDHFPHRRGPLRPPPNFVELCHR